MMMLVEQMKSIVVSIVVSIVLIILFCIWNLSNLLFTSIDVDVVKVMNDVVMMNDEMELMSGDVVMSECVSGWVSEWRSG